MIGQLPKEIGGNYTTGVANVVLELSRHSIPGMLYHTYGTNIQDCKAKNHSSFPNQYMGYRIRPLHILASILRHPFVRMREWKRYKMIYHDNPLRFEIYRDNFIRAINKTNPDILNVHGNNSIFALKSANRKFNLPIVQTFHGVSDFDDEESKRVRPQNIEEARLADYITVLTSRIKKFAIEKLGVRNERIQIISNGCDTDRFYYSNEERIRLRQDLGINEETIIFVTASSVIRRKGQLDFIKVIEGIEIDCQYWIIGKGPDYDDCVAYCSEHNLNEKIKFFGYVPNAELYKFYSAADVFVHASYREAQALCEIEAYACGMKIILNSEIKHSVATSISNSDIYYVIDFNNCDLTALANWAMVKGQRMSRREKDWTKVVIEYETYFESIIKEWNT